MEETYRNRKRASLKIEMPSSLWQAQGRIVTC